MKSIKSFASINIGQYSLCRPLASAVKTNVPTGYMMGLALRQMLSNQMRPSVDSAGTDIVWIARELPEANALHPYLARQPNGESEWGDIISCTIFNERDVRPAREFAEDGGAIRSAFVRRSLPLL